MTARALIVAAPRSGAGKTTVTLGLLAALRRRGVVVNAAKSGPDYIDLAFHAAATGAAGVNLDSWAMEPALIDALMHAAARDPEYLVVEGAMGLFDGVAGPRGRTGAAADLAKHFRLPVLLVLDVSGQSQSAAAIVRGFAAHDPAVRIAGVVLNRVASERHRMLVAGAIDQLGIPVLGSVPRDDTVVLPARHLGLVQAVEHADLAARLSVLADMAERHIDLDAVLRLAVPPDIHDSGLTAALPPPGQRVALASDAAFSFVYPHLVDGWRRAGAEIICFSPLADEPPPEACDVCWLPGGYPELHAGRLAAAMRFLVGLAHFAESRSVHGECGGYMVLGQYLEDADGVRHRMARLLAQATSFSRRTLNLGYREARLLAPSPIGSIGAVVRGHEFHYATPVTGAADTPLAELSDAQGRVLGPCGSRRGRVSGTFFHAIARQS
jgi:cobyrinic acid a,c-diamide synthase